MSCAGNYATNWILTSCSKNNIHRTCFNQQLLPGIFKFFIILILWSSWKDLAPLKWLKVSLQKSLFARLKEVVMAPVIQEKIADSLAVVGMRITTKLQMRHLK